MSTLGREARNIQNSALGAMLLWRFCVGYEKNQRERNSPPLPLLFLVLPMIYTEEIAEQISSTQEGSGLRVFAGKFTASAISKSDLIFSLQEKMKSYTDSTMFALSVAVQFQLLSIQPLKGTVLPLSETSPITGIPPSIKVLQRQSEKLGLWFSQLSMHEISASLKVSF